MLTPAFVLSQDNDYLTITIKAPYSKIADTEIFIEDNDFKFYSKPYFLRLSLPGKIVENGQEKANYNADTGEYTIIVPKETSGEHFDGLDMVTKLLAPRGKISTTAPLIQVMDDFSPVDNNIDEDILDDEDFDWSIEQTPYTEQPIVIGAPKYGFACLKSGVFERLQEDLAGIVDCPDPDKLSPSQKRELRLTAELNKFDEDHYIADLYADEIIQPLLLHKSPWSQELELVGHGASLETAVTLSDEENEILRKLPRTEYLLDMNEETNVFFGLLDILFGYAYDHRTTEGEHHCESGWTISKISATLSWLEVFSSLEDVLQSCFRRCLCYPLYRHWGLSNKVQHDVVQILKLGRNQVLKCLLEIRSILMDQECRYVLNDLYITDYCVWIQGVSNKKLQSLSEALQKIKVEKEQTGFDLLEVERIAKVALEDTEPDGNEDVCGLTEMLAKVSVDIDSDDSSDTDSNASFDSDSDTLTDTDEKKDDACEVLRNMDSHTVTDNVTILKHIDNLVIKDDNDVKDSDGVTVDSSNK